MKNILCYLTLLLCFFSTTIGAQHTLLQDGYYAKGELSSTESTHYKYYIPANKQGVFTLKNTSGRSDLDLFVYSSSSEVRKIDSGTKGGTKTELLIISGGAHGGYAYLKIKNVDKRSTSFKLNAHYISFEEKLAEAIVTAGLEAIAETFISWLAGVDSSSNENSSKNANRAANIAVSAMMGADLGDVGKNAMINEITREIRSEMGYGFWADFAVKYSIGILSDVYRFYI